MVQKLCVFVLALKSVELKCFLLVLSSKLPHFRGTGEVSSLRHTAVPCKLCRLLGSVQVGLLLLDSTPSGKG